MSSADPIRDWLDKFLGLLCAVPLALIVALTFGDVFARYVFATPLQGATEIIKFAMALTVFTALPLVTRHGEHVTVDLMTHALGKRMRIAMQLGAEMVSGIALTLIAWRLWVQADENAVSLSATIVLGWHLSPLGYAMSVFAALSVVMVALRIDHVARKWKEPLEHQA
jgi:TRAP-type C4-dicarboxylate transport system permease small subunit